jgi:AcrR family transcriptional regulator/DNA-binding MarR family transcriptional regulator
MVSAEDTRTATQPLRPGPGPMPRARVTEIQRSRMLAAAVHAVEEVGYAGMTVAQVIGRAKVSRKTFYDVFVDREDCFLAAFEQSIARARALVAEAYDRECAWRESVRAGLERLLALMDEEPGLARLCVVDALAAGPRVLERRAGVLAELAAVVDRGRLAPDAHEPSEVTAEGVVGAVFAVLHARLLEDETAPLSGLLGPLMSIVVLPYLGTRAASGELARPTRQQQAPPSTVAGRKDPLEGLEMRLTYRTVRVLVVIAAHPGASNREIADRSGVADQGQISKLLTRLQRLELVENRGEGQSKGAANAWHLTERGVQVERATRPR